MILFNFNKSISYLLQIIFPNSKQENVINRLNGVFPLHINSNIIRCNKSKSEYRVTSLADYSDYKVSALIHSLKYLRSRESIRIISRTLGDYLLEMVSNYKTVYPSRQIIIIPIPLSKKRRRERGFNQIELLLSKIQVEYPELTPFIDYRVLAKYRHTKPQTKLSRKERLTNVKGSFRINKKSGASINGAYIILIDDVVTTGATVIEASKTLTQSGTSKVDIVTIA